MATLANAYWSISHKMVETVLNRHRVPSKIKDLILDYYNKLRESIRGQLHQVGTDWKRGIRPSLSWMATKIQSVNEKPVKSLGKLIDRSLGDVASAQTAEWTSLHFPGNSSPG